MNITYRKGTIEDSFSVFQVFTKSIIDLGERTNVMAITGGNNPSVMNFGLPKVIRKSSGTRVPSSMMACSI
jgi:hypothetical protein